ncbi:MAG: SDR family oxidoreductase [Anaerolineales bacterium]|nr:SDR family oxidoreductase [Anaerolineales bacterium]
MQIVITGGAGFLGQQLARRLLTQDQIMGQPIQKLLVFDTSPAQLAADPRLELVRGDITDPQTIGTLVTDETGLIFHLAAVVSGEAEQNFELGMQVNLLATLNLLERCRQLGHRPRLVFASSVAVFGGDLPPVIEDGTALNPQSSYGTQKAVGELLVNDYSRKNFIDGRSLRLPTIVVRPGKPNKAASTFASSIIREPLQGQTAVCPVAPATRMWIQSPRRAIANLLHAAELPPDAWGNSRVVALPGLSVSIQEMVDSLQEIAGEEVVRRIVWQPDPFIEKIVGGWAVHFAPERALALGFEADHSMGEIIRAFIEDELPG